MNSSKNHVGVNIAGNRVQLVELIYRENKVFIGNVDEEFFSGIPDFSLNEIDLTGELQSAFNKILTRTRLESNNVSFVLPSNFFRIAQIPVEPSLSKTELREYLNWEFSVLFPAYKIEDMKLNYIRIEENNFYPSPQVILFAVRTGILRKLHEFSVRNNLALKFIDNAGISAQLLLKRRQFKDDELLLFLYLERNNLCVSIERNGKIIFYRIISFSDYDEVPALFRAEMAAVEDLNPNFVNISKIFLSGELEIKDLADRLFSDLSIQFELLNPFKNFSIGNKIGPDCLNEKYYSFTAPSGIVLRPI